MVARQRAGWRMKVVIGCIAGAGAMFPLSGMAQEQPEASGAAVEVGGVTIPGGLPVTGGGPTTAGGAPTTAVEGVQTRQLQLPRTGIGPEGDYNWALAIGVGLGALGGAYVLFRRSKSQVGA